MVIIKTQSTGGQTVYRKPHRKVTKLKSKSAFSWVSLISCSDQLDPGATVLGWPKSIYYSNNACRLNDPSESH